MIPSLLALTALSLTAAALLPGPLLRAGWTAREPVLGLWVWQCLLGTVLLCWVATLALGAAAAVGSAHTLLFAPAPAPVADAYTLTTAPLWVVVLTLLLATGALWTAAMVVRELLTDRRLRRLRQADLAERVPELPPQLASEQGPLLVLEESYPDAWWQPGRPSRLVVTTGALRRLTNPQVEAVLAHERNHARAGHPWLLRLAAALGNGFPHVPLFRHFCDQTHRLVEYAADDAASRGHGHLTTGLALIELNQHRGVLSCASTRTLLGTRVDRLLDPQPRVEPLPRALATVGAALGPLTPVLITFAPAVAVLR